MLSAACSPTRHHTRPLPEILGINSELRPEESTLYSFDGARLGLSFWPALQDGPVTHVILGVHGMNDYAQAFEMAAPYWTERGASVYAYDQRGFGRSEGRGRWPEEDVMRRDLRTALTLIKAQHPEATVTLVGMSMGASVAMSLYGTGEAPPEIDRLILSGPGLRGWGGLPLAHRISLWLSSTLRPAWNVTPPKRIMREIMPSDNYDMLFARGRDPLNQFENRIDQVYGVVAIMETAHKATPNLPENTLFLYGAKDDVIPEYFARRTTPDLPAHVRTAYYENGYHMLMRDLQAETVWADQWAFMQDPATPLPSNAPPLPWISE